MKILQKYFGLLLLAAGFVSPALAQRGDHHSNSGGGRQSFSSVHQNSSFSRTDRQTSFSQPRQSFQSMNRGYTSSLSRNNRSTVYNNSFTQRNYRVGYPSSTVRVNNTLRSNSVARYGYRGGYRYGYSNHYSYVPRRFEFGGYNRYSILPHGFVSIYFGGYPYYYYNGLFYSYFDGFYDPVYAPFGIVVGALPYGYYPFYWGGMPYYYYDGVYYRDHGDNEYEVVDAPIGAVVSSLPKGAKAVTVNGEKFYEFNGTYYKEGTNDKNEVIYTVVGKNGEINNSDNPDANSPDGTLHIGDIVPVLPENSRQVTINGQTLYVSPDNFYFKERVGDNGNTSYEVVGSGEQVQ